MDENPYKSPVASTVQAGNLEEWPWRGVLAFLVGYAFWGSIGVLIELLTRFGVLPD